MAKTLIESIRQLIEPIIVSEGMELVDIEYHRESRGWVLRFYIDKGGKLTLDHCSHLSKQIGDLIEVKDLIPQGYILEVSSPGLNRPLKKEKDFITHAGKSIKVKTFKPIDQKRSFQGTLLGYKEGKVMINTANQEIHIPFPLIAKANIQHQFPELEKGKTNYKKLQKGVIKT
ncbi:MAG: ribosome maturation factor RimP [Deltaproteobacteria bacterium]|jgi:ribosome maturation factor RimP|nr:ribosome maturation factor RimP [Deltaproteobacteria bacterium]MBW2182384.1 ribosome maturation factor RimP [Deltaproteobacteria bacterium]